jgi:hypothetical protein
MKTYKAEYFNDELEIIHADTDHQAYIYAMEKESEENHLTDLHEINYWYEETRRIF